MDGLSPLIGFLVGTLHVPNLTAVPVETDNVISHLDCCHHCQGANGGEIRDRAEQIGQPDYFEMDIAPLLFKLLYKLLSRGKLTVAIVCLLSIAPSSPQPIYGSPS